jgi:hypothetical protein
MEPSPPARVCSPRKDETETPPAGGRENASAAWLGRSFSSLLRKEDPMAIEDTVLSAGEAQGSAAPAPEAVIDEAHALISSRRVEGTAVYDRDGQKLGSVHSVMIGKRDGRVAYAVLSTGGILGFGSHVHPLPWSMLAYDVDREAYVVDIDREQLEAAPTMTLDETDRPVDREYQERVSAYWGTMPWWGL